MTEEQVHVLMAALGAAFEIDRAGEALVMRPHGAAGSPPWLLRVWTLDGSDQSTDCRSGRLTPREHDVMTFVAQGATNAEVARELSIATVTVRKHLENIFGKLAVGTRTAAVAALRDR